MTDSGARRGAANFAPILMILSFVLMIAFLAWLGLTSEGTDAVAMQEDTVAEEVDTVEAQAIGVTPDDLRLNPEDYEGEIVRIGAEVASAVGSEAFFLDLPQSPFLVKLDTALVAEGREVPEGDVVVTGVVRTMNDSIAAAWTEAGAIGEGEQPLVAFATHYIEARRVRLGEDQAETQEQAGGEAGDTASGGGDEQDN